MSIEVRIPALGESVVSAVIATWLKHEGDSVNQGDALVELETDKVNVEVSAEASGVLQKIMRQEGDEVAVGDVIAMIGEAAQQSQQPQQTQQAQPQQLLSQEVMAAQQPVAREVEAATDGQRSVSPLARRIATEHNVDLSQVKGNSPHGRVTKDDVVSYIEQTAQAPAASVVAAPQTQSNGGIAAAPAKPAPASTPAPKPSLQEGARGREERVRLSRRRQTIAQRLVEAQHTAAMLTTFNEIDMSAVMEIRSRRKNAFKERHQISLGFMSFFTKAALLRYRYRGWRAGGPGCSSAA